jgi:phospholipase/lecithinase/hemolysin
MIAHSAWRRHLLQAAAAGSIAALLAACGDTRPNVESVVSFGDSLSDLGTFQWGPQAAAGGGRYTTNPGTIWVEQVASAYGATITKNRTAGAGNPSPQVLGGYGYAQGGARVTQLPGVGGNPSGIANVPVESTAMPVQQQVSAHLAAVGNAIPKSQLILVMAGANDIFYQIGVFSATVGAGGPVAAAQQAALTAVTTAATELGNEVKRLVASGATKIVVADVPPIVSTPFGASNSADGKALIGALTQAFNSTLAASLNGVSGVLRIDSGAFFGDVLANPAKYGFTNTTLPACTIPTPQNPSSLYCSAATLAAANASNTYVFADGVHPTTNSHVQFGRYVVDRMVASGFR